MKTAFTTHEASEITEVKYPTLASWTNTGLLRPSVLEAHGIGSRRIFSIEDLIVIRLIKELVIRCDRNQYMDMIQSIADKVSEREDLVSPPFETFVICDGPHVNFIEGRSALGEALSQPITSPFWIVLRLDGIAEITKDRVKTLLPE